MAAVFAVACVYDHDCADDSQFANQVSPALPASPCNTWHVARGFSPEQRAALDRAVDRANRFANRRQPLCLADTEGKPYIFRFERDGELHRTWWEQDRFDYSGRYQPALERLGLINDLMPIEKWERLAMHELGHVMGLEHTAGQWAIMGSWGDVEGWTEVDLVECRRVAACQ